MAFEGGLREQTQNRRKKKKNLRRKREREGESIEMQNVKLASWSNKVRKGLQWRRQLIIEKDPTLDK